MYIIGDIHGCFKTFLALVEKLPKDELIILTGDLIDRGPSSKEVVQWVIDNPKKARSVKGNHEQMLVNAYDKPTMSNMSMWLHNGGTETLDSYFPMTNFRNVFDETDADIEEQENQRKARNKLDIPKDHLDFFKRMPLYIMEGSLFVSHTGWNTQIPWENILELDDYDGFFRGLTWYRGTPGRLPDNKFHIFGHTPVAKPKITDYYADIDTGACFVNWEYGGKLTAIHYPTMQIYQQENLDFPDRIIG